MKNFHHKYILLLFFSFLFPISSLSQNFTTILNPDGNISNTYPLIKSVFGKQSIESPDLYKGNNTDLQHIQQGFDDIVGNYFVFYIVRDKDKDRDKYMKFSDRQRNEIKVYNGSKDILKAKENDTFIYHWRFKIDDTMSVSKYFTHIFQLKAVGGDEKHPLLTFTGAKKGNNTKKLEVRYKVQNKKHIVLASYDWDKIKGIWLDTHIEITFAKKGNLKCSIKTLQNKKLIEIDQHNIQLWKNYNFIRPKWGIYRSLKDKKSLTNTIDNVKFTQFLITKVN